MDLEEKAVTCLRARVSEQAAAVTYMHEQEEAFGCLQNKNATALWEPRPQSKFIVIHPTLAPLLVRLWL